MTLSYDIFALLDRETVSDLLIFFSTRTTRTDKNRNLRQRKSKVKTQNRVKPRLWHTDP